MLDGLYWEYWYNTGSDKSVNLMMIFDDHDDDDDYHVIQKNITYNAQL